MRPCPRSKSASQLAIERDFLFASPKKVKKGRKTKPIIEIAKEVVV